MIPEHLKSILMSESSILSWLKNDTSHEFNIPIYRPINTSWFKTEDISAYKPEQEIIKLQRLYTRGFNFVGASYNGKILYAVGRDLCKRP